MAEQRKPKIFVASSVEGLGIAYAIQQNLHHDAEVTVWDQGVFQLSTTTLESLLVVLSSSDFALFVFSPDDMVKIRGQENAAVRDNVIFELGLFIGKLGRNRSFIFIPENTDLRIPTDLIGLAPATYEIGRSDESDQAACGPACHQVRIAIQKLGFVLRGAQASEGSPDIKTSEDSQGSAQIAPIAQETDDHWMLAFGDKDYDKAARLLKKQIKDSKTEADRERNEAFLGMVEFEKDAAKGAEYFEGLLQKSPEAHAIYSWYAYSYFWSGLYEKALEIIERGLEKVTEKGDLIGAKARTLGKLGKVSDAIRILERGITEFPNCARLYVDLAAIYRENKEFKKAANRLVRGIQVLPKNQELLSDYAALLSSTQNNIGAVAVYSQLTALDDKNPSYRGYLGNAYLLLDLNDLAYEAYRIADELAEHKQAWIIGNIGNLMSNRGLPSEAIRRFNDALRIQPESQYSHERLASALTNKATEEERLNQLLKSMPPIYSLVNETEVPPTPPILSVPAQSVT